VTVAERPGAGPDVVTAGVRDGQMGLPDWSLPMAVGIVAFVLVLVLRIAGIAVGPVAVILGVACIILLPGPARFSDRFLVAFALGFGWLPLVGWVPALGTTIDVPGVFLAVAVGVAAGYQIRRRRMRRQAGEPPAATEITGMVIGIVGTLWWTFSWLRLTVTGQLRFLFSGWDNSSHFDMLRQNIVLGSFIAVRRHTPGGGLRLLWDYPQGIYQAWAQLARLWSPHPPATLHWMISAYGAMLLLSLGAVVVLGCMNIARLCRRDPWVALPAMAVVVAIFVLGRLWIYNGYPNFGIAVASTAVAVTAAWRPTLGPWLGFVTVSGLALVAAYTWYPLLVLAAPATMVVALRLRSATPARARYLSTLALAATVVACAAPLLQIESRGVGTLSSGVAVSVAVYTPGTPWGLFVLCAAVLIGVACARQAVHADLTGNLIIASPAILGALGVLFLAVLDISKSNRITYYGQKFTAGVFAICLIVLVSVLAKALASSELRRRASQPYVIVVAVMAAVAGLQIDGYVGPWGSATGATLATGFSYHQVLDHASRRSGDARNLLVAAQFASDYSRGNRRISGQWWYVDPNSHFSCAESEEWFAVLAGEPTVAVYAQSFHLPCGYGLGVETAASYIVTHFGNPAVTPVHIFVPKVLAKAVIARDREWKTSGALLTVEGGTVHGFG